MDMAPVVFIAGIPGPALVRKVTTLMPWGVMARSGACFTVDEGTVGYRQPRNIEQAQEHCPDYEPKNKLSC